jgi:hypothetical protein
MVRRGRIPRPRPGARRRTELDNLKRRMATGDHNGGVPASMPYRGLLFDHGGVLTSSGAAVRRLALPALLAAVLLAGCGGKSLSGGQLHTRASQLCLLASARTDRIPTPGSPDGSAAFLEQGISVLTRELTSLRALRPPDDVANVYTATVGSFAQKLVYMKKAAHQIDDGADPVSIVKGLQHKLGPLESQENGGWQALELPECVSR